MAQPARFVPGLRSLLGALLLLLLALGPLIVDVASARAAGTDSPVPLQDADDDDDDEDEDDEEKEEEEEIDTDPPVDNLSLPSDLDEASAKILDEAVTEALRLIRHGVGKEKTIARSLRKGLRKAKRDIAFVDYLLGEIAIRDDNLKEARTRLTKALAQNDQFFEAHAAMGKVHMLENDSAKAEVAYKAALDIHPWDPTSLEGYADALTLESKWEEARDTIVKYLKATGDEQWIDYAKQSFKNLVEGPEWSGEFRYESKHYLVRTSVSEEFAKKVAECAEQARGLYDHYFPEIERFERKYDIFVFKDRGEYRRNGGPPTAGGHYNPMTRVLNLFQYDSLADTLLVLQHEGFHQYCDEYLDAIPQWFNEGLGDFFGGAIIEPGGRRASMAPSHWRVSTIQQSMSRGSHPTAAELMQMSRAEMYGRNAGVHYAQAWAMTYYCLESGNKQHANTMKNYFKLLRKGANQQEAFKLTFQKIDMTKFERDWKRFVDKLPSSDVVAQQRRDIIDGD